MSTERRAAATVDDASAADVDGVSPRVRRDRTSAESRLLVAVLATLFTVAALRFVFEDDSQTPD